MINITARDYALVPLLLFFATCVIFRVASCAERVADTSRPARQLQQAQPDCSHRPPTK